VPAGTPRWGSEWKKQVARYYNRSFGITTQGACQSYRGNYLEPVDVMYQEGCRHPSGR
jgi:gluconate 2-dehydrogenase alpha chain